MLIYHGGTKDTKTPPVPPTTTIVGAGSGFVLLRVLRAFVVKQHGRSAEFAVLALALVAACARGTTTAPAPSDPGVQVTMLADAYVAGVFDRVPELVTRRGLPG